MEVGQASVTGAGNLWMQTEDPNIAQNMHDAIPVSYTHLDVYKRQPLYYH